MSLAVPHLTHSVEKERVDCDNCFNRHVTSEAIEWCPVCEEALCTQCKEHHNASKLSKSHKTMTIFDYRKLPSFVLDIKIDCEKHGSKYELFCTFHQKPCCKMCVKENHWECKNFNCFDDVVRNIKSSSTFEDIERSVEDVIENIDILIKNRQSNKSRLLDQKESHLQNIHTMRLSINERLDRIEKSMKEELSSKIDNAIFSIDALERDLSLRKENIVKYKEGMTVMKALATERQTYFGLEILRCKVDEDVLYQQALVENSDAQEIDIKSEFSAAINSIFKEEPFGDVNIVCSPMSTKLVERKKDQAQFMKTRDIPVENFTVITKKTIYIKEATEIVDGILLPLGQMVFCSDDPHKIIVYNADGSYKTGFPLGYSPCSITYMNGTTVAVSSTNLKKVGIIDLWFGIETNAFNTSRKCYDIIYSDERFYIRITGNFVITDSLGIVLQTIPTPLCRTYICLADDMLYSTNSEDDTVLCYNKKGELSWMFENEILKCPCKITADKNGYVFVAGKNSQNIVVISPDGKMFNEVFKTDIIFPSKLFFDTNSQKLLVSSRDTISVLLCDISSD